MILNFVFLCVFTDFTFSLSIYSTKINKIYIQLHNYFLNIQ